MTVSLPVGVRRRDGAGGSRRMLLARRKAANLCVWSACVVALGAVLGPLAWLVWGVIERAAPHWQWSVITTKPTGVAGGLSSAIVGTLVLVAGVALIAGGVGIGAGIYLSEICPEGKGGILRTASEVLSGVPSIVLGYVGYTVFVVAFHWGFSLAAALMVLSLMVVPYVTKATEVALSKVPSAYREGAMSLGMSRTHLLRRVVLRPALPGIATGLILALAIAVGETAPLLYTAGWSAGYPPLQPTHSPLGYLTYVVWTYYQQPAAASQQLAYSAALLLLVLVVLLIGVARLVVRFSRRYSPEEALKGRTRGGTSIIWRHTRRW